MSESLFRHGDGQHTRPVPPEEQAMMERLAGKLIPLCSVPRCEKLRGHDGEHGPVRLIGEQPSGGHQTDFGRWGNA